MSDCRTPTTKVDGNSGEGEKNQRKRAPGVATLPSEKGKKKKEVGLPNVETAEKPFRGSRGIPRWMTYLTVDNFHTYSILGEETHIKCALYLTIKVSFGFVYANKEKDWAKLTLAGLNRVMNFNEIMRKDGKKLYEPFYMCDKKPFRMEDLQVVGWKASDDNDYQDTCWNADDDVSVEKVRDYLCAPLTCAHGLYGAEGTPREAF